MTQPLASFFSTKDQQTKVLGIRALGSRTGFTFCSALLRDGWIPCMAERRRILSFSARCKMSLFA